LNTDLRLDQWSAKLLAKGFVWKWRSGSPVNLENYQGSGRFGFARYVFGAIQVDRLCGRHIDSITEQLVPLPDGETWYQRAKLLLPAEQLDITARGKLNNHTCHYFELNGKEFTAATVMVEISVRRETFDDSKGYEYEDEFLRLSPLYFEFAGDERAYRNAINMALFQLA
jgi:hypothetical protein